MRERWGREGGGCEEAEENLKGETMERKEVVGGKGGEIGKEVMKGNNGKKGMEERRREEEEK